MTSHTAIVTAFGKEGECRRTIVARHHAEAHRVALIQIRNGEWPDNCLVNVKISGNGWESTNRYKISNYKFGSGVVIEDVFSK